MFIRCTVPGSSVCVSPRGGGHTLGIDRQRCAGLGVARFRRHCGDADVGVGQQDADEGVPEHVGVQPFDARLFADPPHQTAVAIRVDGEAVVVADHKVIPSQSQQGRSILGRFSIQAFLPGRAHHLFLSFPLPVVVLQESHKFRRNVHIPDIVLFGCGELVAEILKDQQRLGNVDCALLEVHILPRQSGQLSAADAGIQQRQNDRPLQQGALF